MVENNLILHCGAQAVSRAELYGLPEPVPAGPRHQPVHHADFVDLVESTLESNGYEMKESAFGITPNGMRLFGVASVAHQALREFDGGEFVIGFRGSHDQTLPRGLSAGSRIFVCDNLAFSGEQVVTTKHTTNIHERLPAMLEDMIAKLRVVFERQTRQLDSYRVTDITDTEAKGAIIEMGRRGIVNWSELAKVDKEWREPSHEEHAEGDNVWRLFNAATETLKIRNPDHPRLPLLAPKTARLHTLCDELALAA